jgi:CRP-like cAMP-binding protein
MYHLLLESIANSSLRLTPDETDIVQQLFRYKKYRRHQYILQQGEICRYETFIINGLTRTYEIDDKGQEHVLYFNIANAWTSDLCSFFSATPAKYNIDCLRETEVLQITKNDLEVLYTRVPKMNVYFRMLYQNAIMDHNRRLASTLSKSALERYLDFRDRCPLTEQMVPNHQIAAYLGITPQSLSRLRKQSTQKV